jgi:hypothetical protein
MHFVFRMLKSKEMLYCHHFFNFASEYIVKKVEYRKELEMHGTFKLLVYAGVLYRC